MTIELPWEIEHAHRDIQAHYKQMIENGVSPRLAEMLALQQPPGTKGTDRAFMEGRYSGSWIDELPPRQAKWMIAEAKKAGINPSGKFYCSGLADKRGHLDPEAWVDSVDDVKKVAIKRGKSVSGSITVDAPEAPPPKSLPLNPKIERELVRAEMRKDSRMSRREAQEVVRKRHVPHWKQKAT